jgi:anhydro-N-acetylmuramic acid kinase
MPDTIYVGLMSGTSLDAIDAVAVDFEGTIPRLIAQAEYPYPGELRDQIIKLISPDWRGSIEEIGHIHAMLGDTYATAVNTLLDSSGLNASDITAIGSHGQTVHHAPRANPGFSLQLGDPSRIAENTGITTIGDFRQRDIAAGGEGAPLVPAFHKEAFYSRFSNRVILNIGGIANITWLPTEGAVIGFDTGPGNTLMDLWIRKHHQSLYDRSGKWAASGLARTRLLDDMLKDPFFSLPPPKSTGREQFNLKWLESFPLEKYVPEDIQATLSELTARSICESINIYAPGCNEIYVCGGGSSNSHLMERLVDLMPSIKIATTAELGVPANLVEATAFAWLARQTLNARPGSLCEATGATGNRILGGIYQA